MKSFIKKSFFSLIFFIAVISIVLLWTNAHIELLKINWILFALACFLFLFSVFVWLVSWAFLIRKKATVSYQNLFIVGFSSLYGALTPVQLGAEALRSMKLKSFFKIPYDESISASMIAKGTKFIILAIFFVFILLFFISKAKLDSTAFFALLSGFFVIAIAILFFVLPLSRRCGSAITSFLRFFSKDIPLFASIEKFFFSYSKNLRNLTLKSFAVVLLVSLISYFFEFLAFQFSFFSVDIKIDFVPLLVLFVIISVIERTPFLPRGIGLVEFVGLTFLSIPWFVNEQLSLPEIGAVLIAFDFVRLVIPTVFSLLIAALFKIEIKE
ncbi:flippase-like domain-containing protein [Candidatus Micrarchaeota archaeon]|nr:flippase-like domain-containing protein [Candidatus Micrarchaeota archaeon]